MTDQEFLQQYDPSKYEHPSVSVDMLIFSMDANYKLNVLLVKRDEPPFQDKWSLPGGFVSMKESLEDAAVRKLREETGIQDIYLEQLYTFGAVDRDPRTRVISVVYLALLSKAQLEMKHLDNSENSKLFKVEHAELSLGFSSEDGTLFLSENDLAFDHKEMIRMGLKRLAGKFDYTDIAFSLLVNKKCFTMYEYECIYNAISGKTLEPINRANFRRDFQKKYVTTGLVKKLDVKDDTYSKRAATCYCYEG